jgi:hypothetical protein
VQGLSRSWRMAREREEALVKLKPVDLIDLS